MFLPHWVLQCICALEQAGYRAYAVGGCVRDALLGLEPHDYDLCTSATPEQICSVFDGHHLLHNGQKHGTIGVVTNGQVVEITTFRTEGDYRDGRHPDWVRFVTDIQADLARRDFTVNAMAYTPSEGYVDPWGGQQDLKNKILRAVGNPETRFTEDALRILRGVRFAVRFGLTPEPDTENAMIRLAPLMEQLARERVFDELCKLLPVITAPDLLRYEKILTQVLPELAPCVGFDQRTRHHIHDIYTHTAHVVESVPPVPALRWAALLHDIGKPDCFSIGEDGQGHFYGHAQRSAEMASDALRRLKSPTALREQVHALIEAHMTLLEPDRKLLRRRLSRYGQEVLEQLLELQEADFTATGTKDAEQRALFRELRNCLNEVLAEDACLGLKDLQVNGQDLMALGIPAGPALGKALNALLQQVLDETLPNEKEALLDFARAMFTK